MIFIEGCDCEEVEIGNRIIGGHKIDIKHRTYMVGLLEKQPHQPVNFRGGAVIVARNIAITAAHCVKVLPVYFMLLKLLAPSAPCFRKRRIKAALRTSEETQPIGRVAILSTTRFAQRHFIRSSTRTILTTISEFFA